MPSPSKKRKLNNDSKATAPSSKGLQYFFAKQTQSQTSQRSGLPSVSPAPRGDLTDEELARQLQDEWNQQIAEDPHYDRSNYAPKETRTPLTQRTDDTKSKDLASLDLPGPTRSYSASAPTTNTLTLQATGMSTDIATESIPLDESPLTFNPSIYMDSLKEQWKSEGGDATYALLIRCFVLVNSTTSRIKTVDTLVNCLRVLIEGDPKSLLPAVWLATNSISPPYISLELGLGGSAISKALRQACGLDNRTLKSLYDKHGDAGDVAFEAKKKQSFTLKKSRPLTIQGVFDCLVKIANSQGKRSGETKQRIVDRLLRDSRGGEEIRFVVRTLCQHLRIGAVKTTMLIALSRAFLLSQTPEAHYTLRSQSQLLRLKKEEMTEIWAKAEEIVKACFAKRPNYNDLIPAMLEIGVTEELLVRCGLTLHVPLRPMLGSITRDLSEMLTKLQGRDFACEYKYDGQRAQIHCDSSGQVSIFSRHLELMTDKYPDLVELVPKIRGDGVSSFIMEGEVVAVDRQTGELKNFQTLTNRARKDVAIGSITIDVCLYSFDLMYLNGQPLLDRSFRERRELLRSLFKEIPHHFTWVKSMDATSGDSEAVLEFFKTATEAKCEGIMVKILDNLETLPAEGAGQRGSSPSANGTLSTMAQSSGEFLTESKGKVDGGESKEQKRSKSRRKPLLATYEPDKRLDSWLKVKKDYNSSFDTLDLIPVAGWHGQGRKAKWWSPILLACRNPETGSLEVVCKCISGFTDAFYRANKEFYDNGDVGGEPKNVRSHRPSFIEYPGPSPDVWFEPQEVWEMAFADITLSPTYTAAIGLASDERGLSLRFPRFLRKRDDKSIEEASSSEFLASLWRKQEAKAGPTVDADRGDDNREGHERDGDDDEDDKLEA